MCSSCHPFACCSGVVVAVKKKSVRDGVWSGAERGSV